MKFTSPHWLGLVVALSLTLIPACGGSSPEASAPAAGGGVVQLEGGWVDSVTAQTELIAQRNAAMAPALEALSTATDPAVRRAGLKGLLADVHTSQRDITAVAARLIAKLADPMLPQGMTLEGEIPTDAVAAERDALDGLRDDRLAAFDAALADYALKLATNEATTADFLALKAELDELTAQIEDAVRAISRWVGATPGGDQQEVDVSQAVDLTVPDNDATGIDVEVPVHDDGAVGDLTIALALTSDHLEQLAIDLVHPDGTIIHLADHDLTNDGTPVVFGADGIGVPNLDRLSGKPVAGSWHVRIRDDVAGSVAKLTRVTLSFLL